MIILVEWLNEGGNYELHTAFHSSSKYAKGHFEDALENSSTECSYPYISLTVYSDDGKTFLYSENFKSTDSAIFWWNEITQVK